MPELERGGEPQVVDVDWHVCTSLQSLAFENGLYSNRQGATIDFWPSAERRLGRYGVMVSYVPTDEFYSSPYDRMIVSISKGWVPSRTGMLAAGSRPEYQEPGSGVGRPAIAVKLGSTKVRCGIAASERYPLRIAESMPIAQINPDNGKIVPFGNQIFELTGAELAELGIPILSERYMFTQPPKPEGLQSLDVDWSPKGRGIADTRALLDNVHGSKIIAYKGERRGGPARYAVLVHDLPLDVLDHLLRNAGQLTPHVVIGIRRGQMGNTRVGVLELGNIGNFADPAGSKVGYPAAAVKIGEVPLIAHLGIVFKTPNGEYLSSRTIFQTMGLEQSNGSYRKAVSKHLNHLRGLTAEEIQKLDIPVING